MTSPGEFTVPQDQQPKRSGDDFSPPGDYYAPFFDVVFYRPSPLQGAIENYEEQALIAKQQGNLAAAASNLQQARSLQGISALDIAGRDEIGASSLTLRSVGGGLQTYDPAGTDSPLGELVNYRANLEVTMLSAAALQATLTLTPPYEDALRIIDSQAIKFGSLMEVQWGYLSNDGGTPAISDKGLFSIVQPSIKFGRETTITIGGYDIISSSLTRAEYRTHWKRDKYPCDLSILKQLIKLRAPAGVKLEATDVGSKSALRKNKRYPVVQADSDWVFFRRLCRQNDVAFEQKGATVHLHDEGRIDIAKPKYRLTWFMQPEGELDIPMISFETNPILGYFAGEGSRGQRTFMRDPDTGKLKIEERDPAKTGAAQVGAKAADATKKGHKTNVVRTGDSGDVAAYGKVGEDGSGRVFTQPGRRPNQKEETDRENREIRRYHNTRATAVCPGVPGLIPQQICQIVNAGKVFSGCYRIMKTVHTIGAGYTVKVDLLRASSTGVLDGTPATKDRAHCVPLDPQQQKGEKVNPKSGDDGPILRPFGKNAGCVSEALTGARDAANREAEKKIKAIKEFKGFF